MELKLLKNIQEELTHLQNYTFKSLDFECNKGINTGRFSIGYLAEKSDILSDGAKRIDDWIGMLITGVIQ